MSSHLDGQRFTLESYQRAIADPIDFPDQTDPDDPRYYKKHAHTIPPPSAYLTYPKGLDKVNTAEDNNCRMVFDWSNMTDFEIEQVAKLKEAIRELGIEIPEEITDSTLLKYAMGDAWDMGKAA